MGATAKNSSSAPQVGNGDPNLQVTALWTNVTPYGGQPVSIRIKVKETNGVNAPRSCTMLKIDGVNKVAFCESIPANVEENYGWPVVLSTGTHTIEAIADYNGEVAESNEGDNSLSRQDEWRQIQPMRSEIQNLRQRYYKNEAVQYNVYLSNYNGSYLDGAYVTTFNPFEQLPEQQTASQQGHYWFSWNATETGLKQFSLNSFKYGYYQKNNYRQVIVTPETARLYATVFNSTNKPVWGAKFKIDGEDRGAAGRNGQIVIPSERGDRRVQVSCPNNNACFDQNIYLNGNTERRFTCNCPDSTTNVVLNLTAFSDALPPNDEYISANGLPIANAMVSVDEEFDSLLNATDAGGMLAIRNIPYGFHDFHFYYCLEWNNNTNQCKENSVWRSYSRANVQQGTRYVNFALNVDAMRPQGGQANFESFTYKDGKWVMTAGEYKSEIFPFLAVIAIQLAISYLNEQDLIRRGCFVNGELDYSRSDCVAQGWGVEAAMMIGPGGIPLAGLKAV
ncbi:MAG TPA: CARDB domain-containing protein, partial [archaeon]|nr:CARDB domain-containing protein [archaeon]